MRLSTATYRLVAALALALGVVLGPVAAAAHGRVPATVTTIMVVDDHNNRVILHGIPHRIIAMAPNVVEILYALGAGNRVVGVSDDTDYPAAAAHKPVVVTFAAGANVEKIVALHPDLVMAAGIDTGGRYLPKLRSLHLPTVVLDPGTLPGILRDISIAGLATGSEAAANALIAHMQARIDAVTTRVRHTYTRPRVYYEIDYGKTGGYTYGRGSFGDALMTMAGGDNIGRAGMGPYPLLSPEKIIGLNPQVIVLGNAPYGMTARSVRARPGFGAIDAVRHGRIYPINDSLVSRPGPRIVDGLEQLARLLHPEAFK